jgi:hypothetical protein
MVMVASLLTTEELGPPAAVVAIVVVMVMVSVVFVMPVVCGYVAAFDVDVYRRGEGDGC